MCRDHNWQIRLRKLLIVLFCLLGVFSLLEFIVIVGNGANDPLASWGGAWGYFTIAWLSWYLLQARSFSESERSPTEFKLRPLTFSLLLASLYLVRRARVARRALFGGSEPPWADDLFGILGYVNVLGIVPTVAVIMLLQSTFSGAFRLTVRRSIPSIRRR